MDSWLFNLYMDEDLMVGVGGESVRMVENRRKWKISCLLYADDFVCVANQKSLRKLDGYGIWCVKGRSESKCR